MVRTLVRWLRWPATLLLASMVPRGGAIGADPNIPHPWSQVVDELDEAQTLFLSAGVGMIPGPSDGSLHTSWGPYRGTTYVRADEYGRLVADIEQYGRLSFDGSQLWFDRPDAEPPYRLQALEPIANQLIPYLRSGMPGSNWRVVTAPEPGLPSVHDEMWAEVQLPFAWTNPLRIYVRTTTDSSSLTIRVVDAATGEPFEGKELVSSFGIGSRYYDIPLEPDLHLKTYHSLQDQGLSKKVRDNYNRPWADSKLMYHERLLRMGMRFDAPLSNGDPFPGTEEGPGRMLGPVFCTSAGPTHTQSYSFVWTPKPDDPRLLLAQSASDNGCALRLTMSPIADLTLAGGVQGRIQGGTTVTDTSTMAILGSTPLDFMRDEPGNERGRTQRVTLALPPNIDVAALVVELSGTLKLKCLGPSTPAPVYGDKSFARVWFGNLRGPELTWDHCGWQ